MKLGLAQHAASSTTELQVAVSGKGQATPDFIEHSPLLRDAYAMAYAAHHGPHRRGDTDIAHPVAVTEVLFEYGVTDDEVLAAALLHDVVEDTATSPAEIGERFGERVRGLVEVMTENPEIRSYAARKAEHRTRIAKDRSVSAIYAADKLASTRHLRRDPEQLSPERLAHYCATLELLCDAHPELPFLSDLRSELELLRRSANGSPPP
jgi:(p)ppGpp synthase/HD superfamily hydrolase